APWKIRQTAPAVFPQGLMRAGVAHGEARVRVSIGAGGELLDALVVASTHRDFGDEALRAVKQSRFEPAREKGRPVGVVADVTFAFVVNGPAAVEKRDASTAEPAMTAGPSA